MTLVAPIATASGAHGGRARPGRRGDRRLERVLGRRHRGRHAPCPGHSTSPRRWRTARPRRRSTHSWRPSASSSPRPDDGSTSATPIRRPRLTGDGRSARLLVQSSRRARATPTSPPSRSTARRVPAVRGRGAHPQPRRGPVAAPGRRTRGGLADGLGVVRLAAPGAGGGPDPRCRAARRAARRAACSARTTRSSCRCAAPRRARSRPDPGLGARRDDVADRRRHGQARRCPRHPLPIAPTPGGPVRVELTYRASNGRRLGRRTLSVRLRRANRRSPTRARSG